MPGLMPGLVSGLVLVMGAQALSRSRRQSHAGTREPWERCRELVAGAEDAAMGHAAGQRPHPQVLARPYNRTGLHQLLRTCGATAASRHRKPGLAQRVTQRGSHFPRCFPPVGARGRQGPTAALLPAPCHQPGLPIGTHGSMGFTETLLGHGPEGLWLCRD